MDLGKVHLMNKLKQFVRSLVSLPFNLVRAFIPGCDSQFEEIPFPCSYQSLMDGTSSGKKALTT